MNIEEKAKAYDEALKKAKKELAVSSPDSDSARQIFRFFPQLAESEDEKIRKFLIDYFTSYKIGNVATKLNGYRIDDILAYLEKQKEQKPELVQQPPITYTYNSNASRDEQLKMALLALLNSDLIKVAGNKFTKQDLIEWVERIPTDKPAEWSEEDEAELNNILAFIKNDIPISGDTRREFYFFLKSPHPQPHKEIYQAAKPDLAIKFMNYLDENRPDGKMCLSNGECEDIDKAFKENDWAKIMRYAEKYRPSWKPSEKQMKALADALEDMPEHYNPKCALESLERELKKLM